MPTYGTVTTAITRKFSEVFEESNYDETLSLSKEVFTHKDGMSFKYRYAFREFDMEDGNYATELLLCIEPASMCKAKREEIAAMCGIDEKDVRIEDSIDCVMCGSIPIESAAIEADKLDEAKDTVASALPMYDMMRGFSLDRCVNLIGTTGWDLVKEAKGRIKDAIRYTLKQSA